jgi:hypothetical protein
MQCRIDYNPRTGEVEGTELRKEQILCPLLPGNQLKAYSQRSSGSSLYSERINGR